MSPEIHDFIQSAQFYKAPIQKLAAMLPADDATLDEWIAESVRRVNQKEFVFLVLAAQTTNRPVAAKHLARGAMLLPNWLFLGWIATRMTGDLPEPLMEALGHTPLALDAEATAFFVIARWCQQHRGGVLPEGLMARARAGARVEVKLPHHLHQMATLRALAALTRDEALAAVLQKHQAPINDAGVKIFTDDILKRFSQDAFVEIVPPTVNTLATGTTMRRAVAKVGRNEPCPCGSGKKYKQCCSGKDEERLHHSSEVSGHTREEVEANPEAHLTFARMEKTTTVELLRFDPKKIPPELLEMYFGRLIGLQLLDRLVEVLEQMTMTDLLKRVIKFALFFTTQTNRKDILERLLQLHPDGESLRATLDPGEQLLLAQDDPARCLQLLEELSRKALQTEDPDALQRFAVGIIYNKHLRALGIFVTRSLLPMLKEESAANMFKCILGARDELGLPPDDPAGDVMEKRFLEAAPDEGKDAAALREAQRRLKEKVDEVQRYQQSMSRLQKEVARREQLAAATPTNVAAPAPSPGDEAALKELRQKIDSLKSALKERHNERNELRRELQTAHTHLETLRQSPAPATSAEPDAPDREEELLLPQDAPEIQPVRLMEFPKGFQSVLEALPRHVARATVIMTGRLAAGEPAAFVGALRLKVVPNVMRQRIGSDYRLLFRLHPDRLEVIDLINRKDLDRRLKTLG